MSAFRQIAPATVACFLAGAAAFPISARAAPATGTLQVQVNVPPTWQPMMEMRVTEEFVSRIQGVFTSRGYKGAIVEVSGHDQPDPGCYLLRINLTEWRMDATGNVDCNFTADLVTNRYHENLGQFSESEFRWLTGPGRFGLNSAFDATAENGILRLYDALARTRLVPAQGTAAAGSR